MPTSRSSPAACRHSRQRGFTLIEIGLVLLVVALIAGGILKGQELVANSKLKRVANDYFGVSSSIYTYLDRYDYYPGDDPQASNHWPGAINGDGNHQINGNWNDQATIPAAGSRAETRKLWDHLRRAALMFGATGYRNPLHAYGGVIGVQSLAAGEKLFGMEGTVVCMEALSGEIGQVMDAQLDDGKRHSGSLRGDASPFSVPTPSSPLYDRETDYAVCMTL
jgi:prepilin-type N-terminal cleavage/methylation domain-containing protein